MSTRGGSVPSEQLDQLQDKAQKELVMVRQRLEEALSQERRAMRCGLIKKRRELISDLVRRSNISGYIYVYIHTYIHTHIYILTPQNLLISYLNYYPSVIHLPTFFSYGSTNRDRRICRVCPRIWREGKI